MVFRRKNFEVGFSASGVAWKTQRSIKWVWKRVSDKDAILGAEGELKEELAQLSLGEWTGVAESFAEEEQSKQLEDDLEQIAMKEERIQKKTEEIMREYDLS